MSSVNTEIIGLVAATLTTAAFVPQALHSLRTRNLEGVSLGMYATFTLGVLLWLIYGLLIDSVPVIAANVVTLFLAGMILVLKVRHRSPRTPQSPQSPRSPQVPQSATTPLETKPGASAEKSGNAKHRED